MARRPKPWAASSFPIGIVFGRVTGRPASVDLSIMRSPLRELGLRLVRDESGQDLVEYALLTTTIGLAGALAWSFVSSAIGSTYSSWVSGVDSLADPPAPSGSGS